MARARFMFALSMFLLVPHASSAAVDAEWTGRWRADLEFLADTLPKVHANLFHRLTREAFRAELDSLGRRIPRLDHHEIAVELARIVARVGDGHTRLTLPFDSAARFFTGHSATAPPLVPGLVFRQLPVRFQLFEDGLFVVRADRRHASLLGGRVLGLGGMTAERAMAAVEPTLQRDNDQQVRHLLPVHLVVPEILHARGVTADRERVRLVVETPAGAEREAVLAPVPPGSSPDWLEARDLRAPPLAERRPGDRHWFERLPGMPVLYACYREVLDDPDETVAAFSDSLFGALGRNGADRLVLDLRGNVGGNGFLNRPLVRGVLSAPELRRPGGLFVLADRGTFSAAMMLLADLESLTPAVFVGETSGASPNGYGDSRRVRLPNSGLTVRASTLYWQMTDPRDERDGIPAHVPVATRFADWRAGRDPALDSALALARTTTDPAGEWEGVVGVGHQRVPLSVRVASEGGAWSVRLDAPALGARDAPATDVRVTDGELAFVVRGAGPALEVRARAAGRVLLGVARYQGAELPVVLGRKR
jgi:hypothetical protein